MAIIKASPDKFTDQTLAQAGVLSTAAGKTADAVMFFAAAAKLNPYFRDYLYNLAAMMYESKQTADMIPVVHRLVELDPSNPDDLQLFTYAFTGISNTTKDPAVKKWAIDSVQYYGKLAEDMPAARWRTRTSSGRRTGRCSRARWRIARRTPSRSRSISSSSARTARCWQKATATVASVAPGATGNFKVDVPVGGVYGVRYAPLPLK